VNSAYLENYISNLVHSNRVVACPIPVFHSFGLIVGCLNSIIVGSKTVIPSILPDTVSLMKAIQDNKCTSVKGAPVIFIDLINHPDRSKYDLSSLEYILLGASTVPKDLILKIKSDLKAKNVIVGYGQTESRFVF
jgi:fatty-acyl-CoA synthase